MLEFDVYASVLKNNIYILEKLLRNTHILSINSGKTFTESCNNPVSKWCPNDKDSKAWQDTDTFTTTSGYTQMTGQPTHIINDKSSYIDLLFTTNSKLLCDVGVEQTIYNKCHDNIIYRSLNLNIPLPPPYYREVWDYKNIDPVCIQRANSLVNWYDVFSNRTADENVKSLNNILLNIFTYFIPTKVIKFDYLDESQDYFLPEK